MNRPISEFMTPSPFTINARATLADARSLMSRHAIRHLPVLEGGKLVGMLSQRDVQLLEAIAPQEAAGLAVEEAMSQEVLTVPPERPLAEVAAAMAKRKYGSAVIASDRVLGIFTTQDALERLAALAPPGPKPARVAAAPRAEGKAAAVKRAAPAAPREAKGKRPVARHC